MKMRGKGFLAILRYFLKNMPRKSKIPLNSEKLFILKVSVKALNPVFSTFQKTSTTFLNGEYFSQKTQGCLENSVLGHFSVG